MFDDLFSRIRPLDVEAMNQCQVRLDNLTKPLGSLHSFEHLAVQLAGITGNPKPYALKKRIITLVEEAGTPAADQVLRSFASHVSAELVLVKCDKLFGSGWPVAEKKALTKQQSIQAVETGMRLAAEAVAAGVQIMGIGVTGFANVPACRSIVERFDLPQQPEPLELLQESGSIPVAVLTGIILGAAAGGSAIVLDDLETSAAALLAISLAPQVKEYLIASHFSREAAHQTALAHIGIPAYLQLNLSLGCGTGAALGMSLLNAALHVVNDMKTFGEAAVAVAQDGPGALKQSHDVRGSA